MPADPPTADHDTDSRAGMIAQLAGRLLACSCEKEALSIALDGAAALFPERCVLLLGPDGDTAGSPDGAPIDHPLLREALGERPGAAALNEGVAGLMLGNSVVWHRAAISAPVPGDNRFLAALSPVPGVFATADPELLASIAGMLGLSLARLIATRTRDAEHRFMDDEIDRIATIQRALMPTRLPQIPGVSLAADCIPSDRAGGDIYRVAELDTGDDRWGIVIADVSGHGPSAAVLMAMFEALLISAPLEEVEPPEVLSFVNRQLCEKGIGGAFITAMVGVFDGRTRELAYASAGHPPLLWRKAGGSGAAGVVRLDEVRGLPLGVEPDSEYDRAGVFLAAGDSLAMFTDGIVEARTADGRALGIAGIEHLLRDEGEPERFIEALGRRLEGSDDDRTILAIRIRDRVTRPTG